ncbi:MAG: hypothetical protein WCQ67_03885, partial [Treponema sp.]
YIKHLAELSPDTKVFAPTDSSMVNFKSVSSGADIAVGKDIAPYFPNAALVGWNCEAQPFGFKGVVDFFNDCKSSLTGGEK